MMWILWFSACTPCDLDPKEDRSQRGFTQEELDAVIGEANVDPDTVTCDVLCEDAYGDSGLEPSEPCALVDPEGDDVIRAECSHWRPGTNCG